MQGDPIPIPETLRQIVDPQIRSISQMLQSFDRKLQGVALSITNKFDTREREIDFQKNQLDGLINRIRNLGTSSY